MEFSLLLPILSAFVGGAVDFSRVYQTSITLQSAVRNAAEAAASDATDLPSARAMAQRVVCVESQDLAGFVPGPGGAIETCTSPTVAVTFTRSTTAPGASASYPIGTASVQATLDFDLLVPWPLLPEGGWTLDPIQTYSIVQNR